jgi:hypothetical protein
MSFDEIITPVVGINDFLQLKVANLCPDDVSKIYLILNDHPFPAVTPVLRNTDTLSFDLSALSTNPNADPNKSWLRLIDLHPILGSMIVKIKLSDADGCRLRA